MFLEQSRDNFSSFQFLLWIKNLFSKTINKTVNRANHLYVGSDMNITENIQSDNQ